MSKKQLPLHHRIADFLSVSERFEEAFDKADAIGGFATDRLTRRWAGRLSAAFPEEAILNEDRREAGVPFTINWKISDHAWRVISAMRSRYEGVIG